MTEKNITFRMEKPIAVLSRNERGYTKEINLVSWNGAEPKYDIRSWHPDRQKCGIISTRSILIDINLERKVLKV